MRNRKTFRDHWQSERQISHPSLLALSSPVLVPVLPDRAGYATKTGLNPVDFLELALQDERDRREDKNLSNRLDRAGFMEPFTFEGIDWDAPVTFDRDRVRELCDLSFLSHMAGGLKDG